MKPVRQLHPTIIYGPVESRRFGLSLGINICGDSKHCSFNCTYCFRGFNERRLAKAEPHRHGPSPTQVADAVETWLTTSTVEPNYWTVAGNAEPTDHPDFSAVIQRLLQIRATRCSLVKLAVFSNGMGLVKCLNPRHQEVRAALSQVDCACFKLDSACPTTWKRLNRPIGQVSFTEWLEAISSAPANNRCLQTMLVRGAVDNTTGEELAALREAYCRLRPLKLYLMTINKPPADGRLKPVPLEQLEKIRLYLEPSLARKN